MSRGSVSGPQAGAYIVESHQVAPGVSATDFLAMAKTFDTDARLSRISVRSLGIGTGTATAHKARRAIAGNTVVTAAGTQVLSADGGAIAAQAINTIEPSGTTPTLLAAQRDITKGQQLGIFITTDAGTANRFEVTVAYYTKGHVVTLAAEGSTDKELD